MDVLRPGLLRGFFADLRSSAQGGAGPTLMSDVPALPTYQSRSSVPPIALQAAQELVDRHYRLARWRSAPDRGRRRHPTLPEGVRQQGVRHQRASSGVWWADFRNNTVAIGDQNRLAAGGKPNILTQPILEGFEADLIIFRILRSVHHAVLINELKALPLDRASNSPRPTKLALNYKANLASFCQSNKVDDCIILPSPKDRDSISVHSWRA